MTDSFNRAIGRRLLRAAIRSMTGRILGQPTTDGNWAIMSTDVTADQRAWAKSGLTALTLAPPADNPHAAPASFISTLRRPLRVTSDEMSLACRYARALRIVRLLLSFAAFVFCFRRPALQMLQRPRAGAAPRALNPMVRLHAKPGHLAASSTEDAPSYVSGVPSDYPSCLRFYFYGFRTHLLIDGGRPRGGLYARSGDLRAARQAAAHAHHHRRARADEPCSNDRPSVTCSQPATTVPR